MRRQRTSSPLLEPTDVVGTPGVHVTRTGRWRYANLLPTSDIYALAFILYKIRGGRHPYQGLPIDEVLESERTAVRTQISEPYQRRTPAAFDQRRSYERRPQSKAQNEGVTNTAEQLVNDIRRFIAGYPFSVHRENAVQTAALRWCRHHQGITAAVSARPSSCC